MVTGGLEKVFCAGANIRMLAQSSHPWKVNFCKFTNETRNGIEDATEHSGQYYLAAVNGTAAGGGYELALACEEIILIDDGSSAVSLPEVPLLAVLPGTGGLTRVVDKRGVRKDRADVFATKSEGMRGQVAVDWKLVDASVPRSRFAETVRERALAAAAGSSRPTGATGVELTPLQREVTDTALTYRHVSVKLDAETGLAEITVQGPAAAAPETAAGIHAQGVDFWPLAVARELDDAVLRLRANALELGTWVIRTKGDPDLVASYDAALADHARLAGQRDPPLPQADAQALRRDEPQPDRADRAGVLLHRPAARARARLRPPVHAGRDVRGDLGRRRAARATSRVRGELRHVPDG